MIRVVLAVALATALVAAATPALEDARTVRTERLAERELGRVERAALTLAREEEPGARRTLTVSLPGGSPTEAPLALVALGGVPGGNGAADAATVDAGTADTDRGDVFAYRAAGGQRRVRRVETDLRVVRDDPVPEPDAEPLVLAGGETHRLTLRLVRVGGRPTVLLAARRFKAEDGTTPAHAKPTGSTPRGPRLRV